MTEVITICILDIRLAKKKKKIAVITQYTQYLLQLYSKFIFMLYHQKQISMPLIKHYKLYFDEIGYFKKLQSNS